MKTDAPANEIICESCGEKFSCAAESGKCWCFDVDLEAKTLASLQQDFAACLCRNCLEKAHRRELNV